MLKYSNNQALCLMDYEGKHYLLDLESGPLKGRTSIFMWLYPKRVHCLTESELSTIEEERLFSGKTPPIILMAGLGFLVYSFFGDKINFLYINLNPTIYIILIFLAILLGIVFDFIIKKKDQVSIHQKLTNIRYERQIKIRFLSRKDKLVYIVQMLALGFVGISMFLGYGVFLIFYQYPDSVSNWCKSLPLDAPAYPV